MSRSGATPLFLAIAPRLAPAIAALLIAFLPPSAPGQELRTAREIRSLSAEEAALGHPVRITGQVIFSDPPATVFVQDETAGTFFRLSGRRAPTPGEIVSIEGRTFPGLYLPGIEEARFTRVSGGALPPGIPATFEELQDGRYHYQRVTVEGIVRSVDAEEEGVSVVRLAMGSRMLEIRVEAPPSEDLRLVDSRVSVSGLAAGLINDRRQLVRPYLRTRDWSEFRVVSQAPRLSEIDSVSTSELLTFDSFTSGGNRVRISGQVLAIFDDREVFVQDEESSILAELGEPRPDLEVGNRVEIAGFPEMAAFRARLSDATVIAITPGSPPPLPEPIDLPDLYDGSFDGSLVTTEGIVLETFPTDTGVRISLQGGGKTLRVTGPKMEQELRRGMRVGASGICQVERTRSSQYRAEPDLVSLRLRSTADLVILAAPTWWTPRRLTIVLFVLLGFSLLAVLWISILRRQVMRQTLALRSRIQKEAVLEERQRIAREFHDTLEQDLAGLTLRLDAATTQAKDEKLSGFLRGSRHLVTRIQTETRNLVSDLREARGDNAELNETIESLLEEQPAGLGPRIELDLDSLPPLPSRMAHHLKMMTREAVTNALKHGNPTRILIRTHQESDHFEVLVEDDGCGFDAGVLAERNPGHFGCMGIRERARKLGAEVTWRTAPGEGTSMLVRVPNP